MSAVRTLLVFVLVLGAVACQRSAGIRTAPDETAVQPRQVSETGGFTGRPVAWGGNLIAIENLEDRTRLEVLAFPLDSDGVPDQGEPATGRFLAEYRGYLEPGDYAPGRLVTVRGTISRTREGKVGEAGYVFPVVESVEVRLWPPAGSAAGSSGWWPPQLHIGIGVYGGF